MASREWIDAFSRNKLDPYNQCWQDIFVGKFPPDAVCDGMPLEAWHFDRLPGLAKRRVDSI